MPRSGNANVVISVKAEREENPIHDVPSVRDGELFRLVDYQDVQFGPAPHQGQTELLLHSGDEIRPWVAGAVGGRGRFGRGLPWRRRQAGKAVVQDQTALSRMLAALSQEPTFRLIFWYLTSSGKTL
jgi:hypothetical protein